VLDGYVAARLSCCALMRVRGRPLWWGSAVAVSHGLA